MALDEIAKLELEENRLAVEDSQNLELQQNKLKFSHPYDKLYLKLGWTQIIKIIRSNGYGNIIFLGGGTGNEAAFIRTELTPTNRIFLTDLSYYNLRHHNEVFKNYGATSPNGVLSCSFNELPFSKLTNNYCAVAFLCMHHSQSIEKIILHVLKAFNQIIIFEPMTNRFLKFLATFGITQRKEAVDYKPARIDLSFLDNLDKNFEIEVNTFLQIPRDYLPFISHKQGIAFKECISKSEVFWSNFYYKAQMFLDYFLSEITFGNMLLAVITRKGK